MESPLIGSTCTSVHGGFGESFKGRFIDRSALGTRLGFRSSLGFCALCSIEQTKKGHRKNPKNRKNSLGMGYSSFFGFLSPPQGREELPHGSFIFRSKSGERSEALASLLSLLSEALPLLEDRYTIFSSTHVDYLDRPRDQP